jgi:hypothetical protein
MKRGIFIPPRDRRWIRDAFFAYDSNTRDYGSGAPIGVSP